jgi:hypothetical protein
MALSENATSVESLNEKTYLVAVFFRRDTKLLNVHSPVSASRTAWLLVEAFPVELNVTHFAICSIVGATPRFANFT